MRRVGLLRGRYLNRSRAARGGIGCPEVQAGSTDGSDRTDRRPSDGMEADRREHGMRHHYFYKPYSRSTATSP